MKKLLLFILILPLAFLACSDDDEGSKYEEAPIEDLELPSSSVKDPIVIGTEIVIKGKEFRSTDEIWFEERGARAALVSEDGVKAVVKTVNKVSITIIAPPVYGTQQAILKRDGKKYSLGTLIFQEAPISKRLTKFYHSNDEDHDYYAFEYNAEGRLVKIIDGDDDGAQEYIILSYKEGQLSKMSVESADPEDKAYNYYIDVVYGDKLVNLHYYNMPFVKDKNGVDVIKLGKDENAVSIAFQGVGTDSFEYDKKGNVSKVFWGEDSQEEWSYDLNPSFTSGINMPSWFWLYAGTRLNLFINNGLVNNYKGVKGRSELYSFTYDDDAYPVKRTEEDLDGVLEVAFVYE